MSNLRDTAQAVIDRWETPLWKDVPATAVFIHALRDALAETEPTGERAELVKDARQACIDGSIDQMSRLLTRCADMLEADGK